MKSNKKIILVCLILISGIISFNIEVNAATGYEGYAIYRDGAFGGINWHAGLMDDPYIGTSSVPVVHAPGWVNDRPHTKFDSWTNFMNGKTFKGVYRPQRTPSSADRDLFKAMGRNIARQNIKYNVAYQVMYDTSSAGTWVDNWEITSMRCDGVVEYVYEWYGFSVYGSDVTKNDYWIRDAHSGTAITPQKQVNYLTLVKSSEPY